MSSFTRDSNLENAQVSPRACFAYHASSAAAAAAVTHQAVERSLVHTALCLVYPGPFVVGGGSPDCSIGKYCHVL
jgi:hypothetical protein